MFKWERSFKVDIAPYDELIISLEANDENKVTIQNIEKLLECYTRVQQKVGNNVA